MRYACAILRFLFYAEIVSLCCRISWLFRYLTTIKLIVVMLPRCQANFHFDNNCFSVFNVCRGPQYTSDCTIKNTKEMCLFVL